jgi:hypothetical protein
LGNLISSLVNSLFSIFSLIVFLPPSVLSASGS